MDIIERTKSEKIAQHIGNFQNKTVVKILNEIYSTFETKIKSQNPPSTESTQQQIINKSTQISQSTQTIDSIQNQQLKNLILKTH